MIRFSDRMAVLAAAIIMIMLSFPFIPVEAGPSPDVVINPGVSVSISPGAPARGSQYYFSPTGGKWVYDFSEPDPLSVSQNISFRNGVGELMERASLDDFSAGQPGTAPSGWTESDTKEGDLVLDSSVYDDTPGSAHYTSKKGGGSYSVSHTVPTAASSDIMELKFSMRLVSISEGSTT